VSEHPSRFTLALRAAGELAADERDSVEAHLAGCAGCRAAVAAIARDVADYGARADAERLRLLAAIASGPRAIGPRSRRGLARGLAAAALAAAAVALVIVLPGGGGDSLRPDGEDDIRFKGGLAAQVVAKRGDRQFAVRPGDALEPGDALRFVVNAPAAGYVAVLAVEQAGRASVFYPRDSAAAAGPWPLRLESPGRSELPGSIILDDAVGTETYVILYSKSAFSRGEAERAARALATGRGGLPEGLDGRAVGVRKVVRDRP
jgi:hypothetical protein